MIYETSQVKTQLKSKPFKSYLSHWCLQHIFGFEPQCPEGFAQNGCITSTGSWQRVNEIFYFSLTLI